MWCSCGCHLRLLDKLCPAAFSCDTAATTHTHTAMLELQVISTLSQTHGCTARLHVAKIVAVHQCC
jgi:hypothetical protein